MNESPRSGVVRFLQQAKEAAGGTAPQLAACLEPVLGRRPADKTVRAWLRGERHPDGDTLLAMVTALHDRGLSLDQIALEDTDQRPLVAQVEELRWKVLRMEQTVNADRANRGLPPIDYSEAS